MAMDNKKRERRRPAPQTLDKSEPRGAPTEEKELAEVCARFADLCQYFRSKTWIYQHRLSRKFKWCQSWLSKSGSQE